MQGVGRKQLQKTQQEQEVAGCASLVQWRRGMIEDGSGEVEYCYLTD